MKKNGILGPVLLFLATFFWGSTFVAQSSAAERISTFTFLTARSLVGALALWLVILIRALCKKGRKKEDCRCRASLKRTLFGGTACGVAITAASALQQYGIERGLRSGEAGFLTSLYIFIVPLFSFIIYKKRASLNLLFGAVMTAIGLYFLCILGAGGEMAFSVGHLTVLGCAVLYAVHIMAVEQFTDVDGLYLSAIQFSVAALFSAILAGIFDHHSFAELVDAWFPIVYAGIFSTAVAYTLQIFGQKYTPTALASIIMSLESVIAFLCEWICAVTGIFGGPVEMNTWKLIGCVIAFAGIVLAQKKSSASEGG